MDNRCLNLLTAQAPFETTFYFEDAMGHRDSIRVGLALDANLIFNPEYGEVGISSIPFDALIYKQVRSLHYMLSKHVMHS